MCKLSSIHLLPKKKKKKKLYPSQINSDLDLRLVNPKKIKNMNWTSSLVNILGFGP